MTYKLWITPQTHVRITQNELWLFRVPEDKLTTKQQLQRKRRLIRYADYKDKLVELAIDIGFEFPEDGCDITFFMPVPLGRSWNKEKKRSLDCRPHQFKPDIDNLLKALLDALVKKDQKIWRLGSVQKVWTNTEYGWIDIEVPDPVVTSMHLYKQGDPVG